MQPFTNESETGQASPSDTESGSRAIPQKHKFVTGGKSVGREKPSESEARGETTGAIDRIPCNDCAHGAGDEEPSVPSAAGFMPPYTIATPAKERTAMRPNGVSEHQPDCSRLNASLRMSQKSQQTNPP